MPRIEQLDAVLQFGTVAVEHREFALLDRQLALDIAIGQRAVRPEDRIPPEEDTDDQQSRRRNRAAQHRAQG